MPKRRTQWLQQAHAHASNGRRPARAYLSPHTRVPRCVACPRTRDSTQGAAARGAQRPCCHWQQRLSMRCSTLCALRSCVHVCQRVAAAARAASYTRVVHAKFIACTHRCARRRRFLPPHRRALTCTSARERLLAYDAPNRAAAPESTAAAAPIQLAASTCAQARRPPSRPCAPADSQRASSHAGSPCRSPSPLPGGARAHCPGTRSCTARSWRREAPARARAPVPVRRYQRPAPCALRPPAPAPAPSCGRAAWGMCEGGARARSLARTNARARRDRSGNEPVASVGDTAQFVLTFSVPKPKHQVYGI